MADSMVNVAMIMDDPISPKNSEDIYASIDGILTENPLRSPSETDARRLPGSTSSYSMFSGASGSVVSLPSQDHENASVVMLESENSLQDDHFSSPKSDFERRSSNFLQSPRNGRRRTFGNDNTISRMSLQDIAKVAVKQRSLSVDDVHFENPRESIRESIRRVQAYSRRDAPLEYEMTANVTYRGRKCEIRMDCELITWHRGSKLIGNICTDDVVGAQSLQRAGFMRIHYFNKGKGIGSKTLKRKHRYVDFTCSEDVADLWIRVVQELVRWQARAPPTSEPRKIKIVMNPHSGKRRARKIWFHHAKDFFDLAGFECHIEETQYAGHAISMGKEYSADDGFEALVFIGGDGTLCEFMNGLLSRPEHEWREIVTSTPISLISAGTQNAFGLGVGIPTIEAAIYCIIKRKMRPLDVITAVAEQDREKVQYSYCGLGWGIAGDIAAESERYRWLGTSRYAFLKVKLSIFRPKKHTGRICYVPVVPQPTLCIYDDIRDEGAEDQFEIEEGTVYDTHFYDRNSRKSWAGNGGAIRSPASKRRYGPERWEEEQGKYIVVGVLNTAPDGKFVHPSDGNLDLVITRKGNLLQTLHLGILYLFGKEFKSPLITYKKVKAVVIEQYEPENSVNIDGEVLLGPGPWRMEIVPSLFKALSEK